MKNKIGLLIILTLLVVVSVACAAPATANLTNQATANVSVAETVATPTVAYPLTETGQTACYDTDGAEIDCPAEGEALYGQDSQFSGNAMSYTDNGDGTVTDNITGLTWQQTPTGEHISAQQATEYCASLELGGTDDWRVPSAKELFSIDDFSQGWPYINTDYFNLSDNMVSKDEQYWTSNAYEGITVEGRDEAVFGVNFGTGHIKAYPGSVTGPMAKRVRCVSGAEYGLNDFVDNGDGTISDNATGLMWAQADSGEGMDWEQALVYVQQMNAENYLGYNDWRLPNVKELQGIVDYSYAPGATNPAYEGPAIDPLFDVTEIINEAGDTDYPYFWSSTSSRFEACGDYYYAWYVAFGRAVDGEGLDSHGAGAVRFDTKIEDGPLGEGGERIYNYVRLVRGGDVTETPDGNPTNGTCDTSNVAVLGAGGPNGGQPQPGGPPQGSQSENTPPPTNTQQAATDTTGTYPIVDSGQSACYNATSLIDCPAAGETFYGQDAQFTGNTPSYADNGDGTITDSVTRLMWQQSPDTTGDGAIKANDKLSFTDSATYCDNLALAGYTDWQLPSIKQLYSLIEFSGKDPSGYESTDTSELLPFIDTNYFDFAYGDTDAGERIIDSQYASSTMYVSSAGEQLLFGVNFADGRIKGYGLTLFGRDKTFFVSCVRGNTAYGENDFVDNGDGTISDNATSLMWAQDDSGTGMNWEEALAYVQQMNAENYLGYNDWRLPNVKELQSLVDYSRSPDTTASAAIDPLFNATSITNEAGQTDYAFYWSSTTHANWTDQPGSHGAYVSFGRALGYMNNWVDVHGAGAQRSDPKTGDPAEFPTGFGPQGDAIRIDNLVRLVRGGDVTETPDSQLTASETTTTIASPDTGSDPTSNARPQSGPAMGQEQQPGGQPPQIDLASAAEKLGVTEEALRAALGDTTQGPPDFAAAAQILGITEAELMDALGISAGGPPPGGGQPPANQP